MKRKYSLDFLRIPAAMMIVMHHYQQYYSAVFPGHINYAGGVFSFGYAVEFFFVLSGFLMLSSYKKIYAGETDFAAFFSRRAKRIIPMLALCALAYDLVEIISWVQSGFANSLKISLVMTVADMIGIQGGWCFNGAVVNIPSWYVCILLLCYILMYALLRTCARKNWKPEYALAVMVLLGIGIQSFEIELPFLNYASSRGFYSFFFGLLIAIISEKYSFRKAKYYIISVVILLISLFDIMRGRGNGYLIAFLVTPSLILIFTSPAVEKVFRHKIWETLGNIQFHVYLWHASILNFAYVLANLGLSFNVYTPWAMYGFALFMEAFGALSYFLLEKRAAKALDKLLPEKIKSAV